MSGEQGIKLVAYFILSFKKSPTKTNKIKNLKIKLNQKTKTNKPTKKPHKPRHYHIDYAWI